MKSQSNCEVIIIGAPRSGTNLLRNMLCSFENIGTWPCDEINYIWRYGNATYPSDEFTMEMAKKSTIKYIHEQFDWVRKNYKVPVVVEKTCANSLRVPFVNAVFPTSKFIFIKRNGLDVVTSSLIRWKAPIDFLYSLKKSRFIPKRDFLFYGIRFIINRVSKLFSKENRLSIWGPNLNNMNDLLKNYSLLEVAAIQWERCINKGYNDLLKIERNRWVEVSYESLVLNPRSEIKRLVEFIGFEVTEENLSKIIKDVDPSRIGLGQTTLSHSAYLRITPLINETLKRFNYRMITL